MANKLIPQFLRRFRKTSRRSRGSVSRSSNLPRRLLRAELLEDRRLLAVVHWDGGAGTESWHDAANWSNDMLPAAIDDVVFDVATPTPVVISQDVSIRSLASQTTSLVLSGGVFQIDQTSTIDLDFTHSGGTLDGAGDLTVSGNLIWSEGTITGSGQLIAENTLSIDTFGTKYLQRQLENRGSATYQGSNLRLGVDGGSGTLINAVGASFELIDNASLSLFTGSGHQFINHGTLTKSGPGTSYFFTGVSFHSSGTVVIGEGTLSVDSGGSVATLQLIGGDFSVGNGALTIDSISVTGTGTFRLEGGTLDVTGTSEMVNFTQTGSSILQGTGDLTVSGNLIWSGGTITGSGQLIAENTLSIETFGIKYLQRQLENRGSAIYQGGNFRFGVDGGSGILINAVGASFEVVDDASFSLFTGSGHQFINQGTLTKSGPGTSYFFTGVSFHSSGPVVIDEGTLSVDSGGSVDTLQLIGGDFSVGNGALTIDSISVTGTGTFRLEGGTLDVSGTSEMVNFTQTGNSILQGAGDLTVSGNLIWSEGTITGTGQLIAESTLSIETFGIKYLQRQLENRGSATYQVGNLRFGVDGGSGTLINAVGASFELVDNVWLSSNSGTDHQFVNQGTLTKSGLGRFFSAGVEFINQGTVIVEGGELEINGDFPLVNSSYLVIDDASSLRVKGSVLGSTKQEAAQRTSGTLILDGNGTDVAPQLFEVQGRNLGANVGGFDSNFSYGSIEVISTFVRLQDAEDNAFGNDAESLYVDRLYVGLGSSLDLNGLTVFVRQSDILGTIIGNLVTVPDGGSLLMNASNPGTIEAIGEQDDWTFYGRAGNAVTAFVDPGGGSSTAVLEPYLQEARIVLFAPSGTQLISAESASLGESASFSGFELEEDGLYTIRIEALSSGSGLGNYALSVFDVRLDQIDFAFNQQMIGNLETRYSVDSWVFQAEQNDQVQFDLIASNVTGLQFTLYGPSGWIGFVGASEDSGLFTLPTTGEYTIVADSLGEGQGFYSFKLIQTTVTDLTLGVPIIDSFVSSGSARLYRFEHDGESPLAFALDRNNATDQIEMYVGIGIPPTRRDYDFTVSDNDVFGAVGTEGSWYVLVYGQEIVGASEYTLRVIASSGLLTKVTPAVALQAEDVAVTLKGIGFSPGTGVRLIDSGGAEIASTDVTIESVYRATAIFDLSAAAVGFYDVRVDFVDGSSDLWPDAVEVKAILRPRLVTNLVMPDEVGRHQLATFYVEYANEGDAPMPAPILKLAPWQNPVPLEFYVFNTNDAIDFPQLLSEGWLLDPSWSMTQPCVSFGIQGDPTPLPCYEHFRRFYRIDESLLDEPILTLDQSLLTTGFWADTMPDGFSTSVQIYAQGETPGFLMPGESVRVPVYYAGQLEGDSLDPLDMRLFVRAADSTDPIDFDGYIADFKPDGISEEAWAQVILQLQTDVGSTWGDYISMLSENAQYLDRIGRPTSDVADLFGFEFLQANGLSAAPVLVSVLDAAMPSPGLSLSYSRTFGNTIAERYTIGPFGRGWQAPSDARLEISGDGTINVYESEAYVRRFQPDLRLDGDFITSLGDTGTMRRLPSGDYRLAEISGLTRLFTSDGKLQFSEDRDGNRITYGYNDDQLASMTHSSGASLTFTYNLDGFINSITDSTGWTKSFAYDTATQQLISTISPAGITNYTYVYPSSATPAKNYALASVQDPTGVTRHYEYDSAGRLAVSYLGDHVELVEYTYDQPGRITVTDETGITGRMYFDYRGQLARMEDASGSYQLLEYDAAGYRIASTDVNGAVSTSNWSDEGQYLGGRDRAFNNVRFEPGGPFGQSLSFTDTKENAIQFAYNSDGNLRSRTFPDGTVESFVYDSVGNVTSTTSRRGQTIQRDYNSLGQLTAINYPDGRQTTFSYDSDNRLETINDDGELIEYTYDSADRVTRIDYPQGRWIAYQYDAAGRRTRLEDHSGYVLNYIYDAVGRLDRLLDASSALIVSYQYDDAGRIASETRGNGTRSVNTYDGNGRIVLITNEQGDGTINSSFGYTYDLLGRRTGMSTLDGEWDYSYDNIGQLVRAEFVSTNPQIANEVLVYEYDSAGNRTRTVRNGAESVYSTNNLNQITSVGATSYQYDLAGNLIRKTGPDGTYQFAYDVIDRLIGVSGPEGNTVYEYDALGNRVAEVKNGVRTEFLIDPAGLGDVIGAYSSDGTRTETFTYGFGLEALHSSGQDYYYDFDSLGSTAGLTADNGQYLNQYAYSPFGLKLSENERIGNAFEFVGQLGVANSIGDLHYMRARFYSAADGRFLSADPIGLAAGDENFYRYVGNSPIERIDASGLDDTPTYLDDYTKAIDDYTGNLNCGGSCEYKIEISIGTGTDGSQWDLGSVEVDINDIGSKIGTTNDILNRIKGDGGQKELEEFRRSQNFPSSQDKEFEREQLLRWHDEFLKRHGIDPKPRESNSVKPKVKHIIDQKGPPDPGGDPDAPGSSGTAFSIDPNEKLALGGFGEQGFIAVGQTIPYRIRFENLGPGSDPVPDRPATAPAQRVVITDQLSALLDWSTLRFTEFGFGEYLIALDEPSNYYFKTLPVVIDGKSFDVEVELTIDSDTGLVRAVFQSLDPAIGLPPDVLTGFLPPEDGTEIGQGFIQFSIDHVDGIADGTNIRNIAEISFDNQTIIATNQIDPQDPSQGTDPLLEAQITIDASPPTSFITLVEPNKAGNELTVQWSGDDGQGSGIASYTLFIAVNGSDPVVLIPETDLVETTIPIDPSRTYQFFVSAVDQVGNRNALPIGFLGDSIAATHDFGDAPTPYPVALILDGARHLAVGPRLGTYRDTEFSGLGNPEALGDNLLGNYGDEDGVSIPNLTAGQQSVVISVDVQDAAGGAYLNAWIDFDQDGIWNDQEERIATDLMVVNGTNEIVFNVPSSAAGGETFARFRLSTLAGLSTTGSAPDGEVEDYMLTIENQPPELTRLADLVTGNVLTELVNNGTWSDPESGSVTLSASLGMVTKNSDGTWNWSYVASTRLENEEVTITADDGANQTSVTFEISTQVNVVDRKVFYRGSSFDAGGSDIAAALDSSKVLAVEGAVSQTLSYDNLINSSRGITGIVLDVAGLVGTTLTGADIIVRMSPQGAFDEAANPTVGWEPAPQPAIIVIPGTSKEPARIRLEWPDDAITNRWLRIEIAATANTGLIEPDISTIGHLLGETTGSSGGIFTVSFADITPIRAGVGQAVGANNIADIDKNGTVAFADISAMRGNVGAQLTNITIPASGSTGGQAILSGGGGSDLKYRGRLKSERLDLSLPQIVLLPVAHRSSITDRRANLGDFARHERGLNTVDRSGEARANQPLGKRSIKAIDSFYRSMADDTEPTNLTMREEGDADQVLDSVLECVGLSIESGSRPEL